MRDSEIIYEEQELANRACKPGQLALTLDLHIATIKTKWAEIGRETVTVTPTYGNKKEYIPIPKSYYVWGKRVNDRLYENLPEGWIAVGVTEFLKIGQPCDMHYLHQEKKYDRQMTAMIPYGFSDKVCTVQLYKQVD